MAPRRSRTEHSEERSHMVEDPLAQLQRFISLEVKWQVQLAVRQMHQDLSNSMPTSPSEQPSSCASVGLPEMDSAHYPVDDLMVQQPCQLHVQFCNISFKVALGMAYPVEQGPVFHGSKVLPGYSRVKLDEVCAGLDDLDLVYPGHEEVAKLGEAVHKVILWSKRYIIFGTNCNNKLSSLTKDLPHLEPVRSRSPTPPQAHIKKICRLEEKLLSFFAFVHHPCLPELQLTVLKAISKWSCW